MKGFHFLILLLVADASDKTLRHTASSATAQHPFVHHLAKTPAKMVRIAEPDGSRPAETMDAVPMMYRAPLLPCHAAEIETAARMMGPVYAAEALDEWARLLFSLNHHSAIHISVPVRSHLSNLTGRHGEPLSRSPWISLFPGTITFERCLTGFLHLQSVIPMLRDSVPSFASPSPGFSSSCSVSCSSPGSFSSSSMSSMSSSSFGGSCVPFGAPSGSSGSYSTTTPVPGGGRSVVTVTTTPTSRTVSTIVYSADGRIVSSSSSSSSHN